MSRAGSGCRSRGQTKGFPMSDTRSERLHALDAVRGFALLLGIVYHATTSFLPGAAIWVVMDSQRSLVLAATFYVLHTFRMSTFFLIAGFFAHMSYHKKGLGGFLSDRATRIALPLVVGWPLLFVVSSIVTNWAATVTSRALPKPSTHLVSIFPLGLWFLYVLILLYSAALVLRGVVALIDRGGRLHVAIDLGVRWLVENPLGLMLLAAPTAVT